MIVELQHYKTPVKIHLEFKPDTLEMQLFCTTFISPSTGLLSPQA